jgi:hypothetical protein
MLTPNRYFRIFFKLSIVCGLIFSAFDAYSTRQKYLKEMADRYVESELTKRVFDCAARLSDEQMSLLRNEYGNYDVARVGCGVGTDGVTYIISDDELYRHRNGSYYATNGETLYASDPNDYWQSFLVVFSATFASLNLFAGALYFVVLLTKWILQ